MELFERIGRIVRAKTDGILGDLENDPRVIDETIIDAKKELAALKATAAPVYAAEKKAKADLTEYEEKAEAYMKAAEQAVLADHDEDAQEALNKSASYTEKAEKQKSVVEQQVASAKALRAKINKLVENIKDMEDTAAIVKSNMANEKAAKTSAKLTGESATGAFDRIAQRSAQKRAEAEALAEMDDEEDDGDDLLAKYGAGKQNTSLAELKARLGK